MFAWKQAYTRHDQKVSGDLNLWRRQSIIQFDSHTCTKVTTCFASSFVLRDDTYICFSGIEGHFKMGLTVMWLSRQSQEFDCHVNPKSLTVMSIVSSTQRSYCDKSEPCHLTVLYTFHTFQHLVQVRMTLPDPQSLAWWVKTRSWPVNSWHVTLALCQDLSIMPPTAFTLREVFCGLCGFTCAVFVLCRVEF